MPTTPISTLKNWFKRGLKPLETQFAAWLDSYFHKDEAIPMASVTDLVDTLNDLAAANEGLRQYIADVTTAPIILDSANSRDILFTGSAAINANKTLQFDNDANGRRKRFVFTITGAPVLTLPGNCKMTNWQSGWDDGAKTLDFGALGAGDYELEFTWKSVGAYFQTTLTGAF